MIFFRNEYLETENILYLLSKTVWDYKWLLTTLLYNTKKKQVYQVIKNLILK